MSLPSLLVASLASAFALSLPLLTMWALVKKSLIFQCSLISFLLFQRVLSSLLGTVKVKDNRESVMIWIEEAVRAIIFSLLDGSKKCMVNLTNRTTTFMVTA